MRCDGLSRHTHSPNQFKSFQTRRVIVVLFCSPHDERRGTASRDRLAKRECACINNKACHVQHPPKKEGKGASHESKKKPITEAHHHVKPTQSLGARHDGTGRAERESTRRGVVREKRETSGEKTERDRGVKVSTVGSRTGRTRKTGLIWGPAWASLFF